uniref:Uncharacterized protein n=1 Tax=Lepeophtheirus salmonis TaxID=72036 RepID=A0A0K2UMI2_LEPSM
MCLFTLTPIEYFKFMRSVKSFSSNL